MSRPDVILNFMRYEIKRAIARRKVLALLAFTILLDTLPYYALSTAGANVLLGSAFPYIWIAGVLAVQPLFLNFTAILIAAGAMSEEYEQGTAELLLSKPVKRNDYFIGKFLGGFTLFLGILAFNDFLSVASAYTFFGPQNGLEIAPGLFLVQAFSALLFFSIAFMLGELIRRSSLAYIFSSAVFFSSFIISAYMDLIFRLTGKQVYETIRIYLPTSPANSLPVQYATPLLDRAGAGIVDFVGQSIVPTIELSVAILLAYTIPAITVAAGYFWFSDISRKMS